MWASNAAQGLAGSGLATSKFWELAFETPTGQSIAMVSLKGKPLLINFWATWCPPCVEELPLINRFYQENSNNGWQVLGLAVDQKSAVNGFLAKMPLNFPVALAGMSGVELSKSLGNLSGGLPLGPQVMCCTVKWGEFPLLTSAPGLSLNSLKPCFVKVRVARNQSVVFHDELIKLQ